MRRKSLCSRTFNQKKGKRERAIHANCCVIYLLLVLLVWCSTVLRDTTSLLASSEAKTLWGAIMVRYAANACSACVLAAGIYLGGCTSIGSDRVSRGSDIDHKTRKDGVQTLGSYALPYRLMRLEIRALVDDKGVAAGYFFRDYNATTDYLTLRDPNHIYALTIDESRASDDSIRVAYDSDGYITKIHSRNTDKTLDLLKAVGDAVIRLTSGVPGKIPSSTKPITKADQAVEVDEKNRQPQYTDTAISVELLDPTDPFLLVALNERIEPFGLHVDVLQGDGRVLPEKPTGTGAVPKISSDDSGLRMRPSLSYRVELKCQRTSKTFPTKGFLCKAPPMASPAGASAARERPGTQPMTTTQALLIKAENASPVVTLDFDRSLFVTRQSEITFSATCGASAELPSFTKDGNETEDDKKKTNQADDPNAPAEAQPDKRKESKDQNENCLPGGGALQTVNYNKPSEMAAFVTWPLELIDSILTVPIKQFRFLATGESEEKALIDAQTELLKSQAKLIGAQTDLENARKGTTPPSKPTETAPGGSTSSGEVDTGDSTR